MRVIKRLALQDFWERWPAARKPLENWYRVTVKTDWTSFPHVRASCGQTDIVKVASGNTVAVFDIGGNKFRLIAKISYEKGKVYVLRVLTHKEYDSGSWKEQL